MCRTDKSIDTPKQISSYRTECNVTANGHGFHLGEFKCSKLDSGDGCTL